MESPLEFCWDGASHQRYVLIGWARCSDHEKVRLRPVGGSRHQDVDARIEEVRPVDPSVPNPLPGFVVLRDFVRSELKRSRPLGAHDFKEEMLLDLDDLGGLSSEGAGPVEKQLHHQRSLRRSLMKDGHKLAVVIESERTAHLCALAIEQDILAYPHVPKRHRTDENDAKYLAAKRAKRAKGEEPLASSGTAPNRTKKPKGKKVAQQALPPLPSPP